MKEHEKNEELIGVPLQELWTIKQVSNFLGVFRSARCTSGVTRVMDHRPVRRGRGSPMARRGTSVMSHAGGQESARRQGELACPLADDRGAQHSKSFARKVDAERFMTQLEHARLNGAYVDPAAGKMTVG